MYYANLMNFRKMKNYFLSFLVLILFLAFTFSIAVGDDHLPVIRVGCYENAPKIHTDKNGSVSGFWPALLKYIASEEGWEIKWVAGTWQQGLERLEKGEIDIMPDTGWTAARRQKYDFAVETVLTSWSQLYVHQDFELESILDFDRKTIGGLKGSVNLEGPEGIKEIVHQFNLKVTFLEMDSYEQVFGALENRKIDAGVINRDFGNQHEDEYNIKRTPILFQPVRLLFAFTKDADLTPFLIEKIDVHMKRLKADKNSIYYQTLEKYIGNKQAETFIEIIPGWIKILAAGGCGVIFFLVAVGVVSRRQVRRRTCELRESRHKFLTHLQNTPIAAIYWDLNFKVVEWNPAAETIFGYSKEEALGRHPNELIISEEMKELVEVVFLDLISEKGGVRNTNENITKDGGRIICDWYNTVLKDTNGKIIGVASLIHDITERIKAEESLKESESQLRTLIDTIPDLVWLKDIDGVYLSCNAKFERFFGAKEAEIVGKTDYDFVDQELADFFRKNDKIAMTTDMPRINEEEVIYADDGHKELLEKIKMPMYDSKGKLVGVLGIARDITDRKKMELQLQEAQKMKSIGTLAGGIAHDFNNILYPIIGFAEMSIDDLPENHPIKENLEDILRGAKRARDLVKQILLFSRQKVLEYKPLQIQDEIEETLKLLRAVIPANIEIHKDLNEASDFIWGDPTEIHEIIMNLCTNAYHAMAETGGTLKVSLNKVKPDSKLELPPGEYCCLSVSDTGTGISPEIMGNIFEPYFTTKEVGKGSGLGLAVIHGIVKNHKGAISVESNPGKGTIFYVYLPLTSQAMESVDMPNLDKRGIGGSESILFVDDEEPIVKLSVRMLERSGYKVIGKTSCIEALELFGSEPDKFDLVITDMAMPCMTGTEFAKKLMEIRSDIPIIICTGFSERLDQEAAKAIGIVDYLHKPILINELSSKVRQVLDQAKKGVTCQPY